MAPRGKRAVDDVRKRGGAVLHFRNASVPFGNSVVYLRENGSAGAVTFGRIEISLPIVG
jgi:hypothetical protein